MKGTLYLIPTPIDNESTLCPETFKLLEKATHDESWVLVVEEHKAARRRWLHWGLPREAIDQFELFNEHNAQGDQEKFLSLLLEGKNIALMSDCGLPAFCDPGQELVYQCHQRGIKVTSTSFANSVLLALALSGFRHQEFHFYGFLPKSAEEVESTLAKIWARKETAILMDTPYRLKKTLELVHNSAKKNAKKREVLLAMDLNKQEEKLILTTTHKLKSLDENKREFVLVINHE